MEVRQGMLRPEFQEWYPGLEAGRWYPAGELTALVVEHLRHGSPQWRPIGRTPSDHHFVFRGGSVRREHLRLTRSTDRPPRGPEESSVSTHPDP